jgi:hypothetical protein
VHRTFTDDRGRGGNRGRVSNKVFLNERDCCRSSGWARPPPRGTFASDRAVRISPADQSYCGW